MSNPAFSIDINALPVADGLGPVEDDALADGIHDASGNLLKQRSAGMGRGKGSVEAPRSSDVTAAQGQPRSTNAFASSVERPSPPSGSSLSQALSSGPRRSSSPFSGPASPGRYALRSASPRHLSPATSQIFERDVQENSAPELSPAIPSHIQTEDHIPPVLEASSLAITDTHLNPDDVEIVMHAGHQPAASTVPASGVGELHMQSSFASHSEPGNYGQEHGDESNATYGAVDPMDPRRLSFISFADVVHAEHVETGKDSLHTQHYSSPGIRSPSPARSPPVTSHPTSGAPSTLGLDNPPMRRGSASITSAHAQTHGDLTIETMRHALEQPLSAANADGGGVGRPYR